MSSNESTNRNDLITDQKTAGAGAGAESNDSAASANVGTSAGDVSTDRAPASASETAVGGNTGAAGAANGKSARATTSERYGVTAGGEQSAQQKKVRAKTQTSESTTQTTDEQNTRAPARAQSTSSQTGAAVNRIEKEHGQISQRHDSLEAEVQQLHEEHETLKKQNADYQRQIQELRDQQAAMARQPAATAQSASASSTEPSSAWASNNQDAELSSRLNSMGGASFEINDDNNPASTSNRPFLSTEPYSRQPAHVGSVQVTGKDKSVAVLEGTNRFTDPNAMARNEETRMATAKIQDVDWNSFDHGSRGNFQSAMMARLSNVDRQLDLLRSEARGSTQYKTSQLNQMIEDLQGRQAAAEEKVDYADTIGADRWDNYKNDFKSQITALEKSVAQLRTALR